MLLTRQEIALIDVREEHAFASGHPLFAASLPLSQIELQACDRLPRKSVPIIAYDDGGNLSQRAIEKLQNLGFTSCSILEDGLSGWVDAGFELFEDVNSASKAFGELVEARKRTPSFSAQEIKAKIDAGTKMSILDARKSVEYRTMTIPTATSVPSAELVLAADAIGEEEDRQIIVNCAGRTRSIIGAQSLINAGVGKNVAALRNGTIGWELAGLKLEYGAARGFDTLPAGDVAKARQRSSEVAYRAGVRRIDLDTVTQLREDGERTTYFFDTRLPGEYTTGHLSGFQNAEGGQLVQETDSYVPVRGARIVLHDPIGIRADMPASWLAQMGWEVYVVDADPSRADECGPSPKSLPPVPDHRTITPNELNSRLDEPGLLIVDLSPSSLRRNGHIPTSRFAIRAFLSDIIPKSEEIRTVVVYCADGILSAFAAPEIHPALGIEPFVLEGGLEAWAALELPLETGLGQMLCEPNDIYKRPFEGVGNGHAMMQAYLDWEHGLVDQLRRDGTHGFFVI